MVSLKENRNTLGENMLAKWEDAVWRKKDLLRKTFSVSSPVLHSVVNSVLGCFRIFGVGA